MIKLLWDSTFKYICVERYFIWKDFLGDNQATLWKAYKIVEKGSTTISFEIQKQSPGGVL